MKKIALFLLLIFTVVQVVPVAFSILDYGKTLIFNIDEEKNNDKGSSVDEKKEKKDLLALLASPFFESKRKTSISLEKDLLHFTPFLEKNTPPPNLV